MMKLKDFFCLFAGIALLALAFLLKGYGEEEALHVSKNSAKSNVSVQVYSDHPISPFRFCDEGQAFENTAINPMGLRIK
ncbi:MAG: hypothetical protein IKH57_15865 [Clostridia bacterium]|nr:hypothetical protein [Clostridia bacterium]